MNGVPQIVGICGAAGVGKDTFAQAFAEYSGYRVARFADVLKETATLWFGWPRAHIEDRQGKETEDPVFGISPRRFMQLCGTDFAREMLGDDIWVKIFQRRYGTTGLVIPDVRFENEATWVRRHKGVLVHVQRANFVPAVVGHASEAGVERDPTRDFVTAEFKDVAEVKLGALQFWAEYFEDPV